MWQKSLRLLNKSTEAFTMSLMFAMVLLVFFQVISRALFDSSFSWTTELARYMMIWVVFLGGGIAFQHAAHISIEALAEKLSNVWKKVVQAFVAIACIAFFIILIVTGIEFSSASMTQTSPALQIPMGLVYLAIPISGVLQILNVIDINISYFKAKE